jgi:hypothetical protein
LTVRPASTMRELADQEIDFIREDIERRGVFTKGLADNLLDHICCFIEQHPDPLCSFEKLYQEAINSLGYPNLQEMQDETLFLIHQTHYKKMKKTMNFAGMFASMALITGSLFKVLHWPGANMLLIASTLVLVFVFSPFFFYMHYKEQTEKKGRTVAILGLITAAALCTGTLFKILHWPGAGMMIVGFALLFIFFLPLYVINGMRNPLTKFSTISNGFLFACVGGFMMLLSFRQPSQSTEESFKQIQKNQQTILTQIKSGITDSTAQKSVTEFIAVCEKASAGAGIPNDENPGNGETLSGGKLDQLNEEIKSAIAALNNSMSANSNWKKLELTPFGISLSGNIRFQILQLEMEACVRAMQ